MKKYIVIIVLLLFVKSGWAQNTNLDFKGAIKFYNQTTVIDRPIYKTNATLYDLQYLNGSYQIFHPTFAVQWKTKKNNFHEIELTDFSFQSGFSMTASLRYEYIVNFYKSKDWKFVPSLGFAFNPYYLQSDTIPGDEQTSSFKSSDKFFGAKFFITPRITYYCGKKIFIDLNVPLCVFNAFIESYTTEDPTLTLEERKTNTADLGAVFPGFFTVRLGIGLKF